ncbi:MAG TPA: acyl-CoA dehydrogenase family protein [Myxococcales bacterium]|nr:acyl-CoA dehydrogenase family protein [Myxococcales bacterium]
MAAATLEASPSPVVPAGGAFLLGPLAGARVHAPEGFTEDQRLYYQTAAQFMAREVMPHVERLEKKDYPLLVSLLRKAGEAGLLSIEIPEAYGGLDLDRTTSMLVAEAMTTFGTWSVSIGAHTGIGSLPIVFFGNDEQKKKYLPKLATAEWLACYALTESGSGSDALGAKTKAVLSADGKHYVLNGNKQFITNAGFADVFIVFAKIDGDKFTGFIVERKMPGLVVGKEEHKMGLRGSSTCQLAFEDCQVPVENVLGQIGKGHRIAFGILNMGRLKLGVGSTGGSKNAINLAYAYAKDRKQFGKSLLEFALIREKLARMAARTYALESMAYRTCGLIDDKLRAIGGEKANHELVIQTLEEYSIESSILKVFGSETLGATIDEAVQIHGGYGYIEEYSVERAYRDQRINRIFEGTNEINRMLITGMLLKKAVKGQLPLMEAVQGLDAPLPAVPAGPLGAEREAAERVKRMALLALKPAVETFGPGLEERQEILAALADVVIEAFAIESAAARTLEFDAGSAVRQSLCRLFTFEARERAHDRARYALCCTLKGADLEKALAALERTRGSSPIDPVAERETIMGGIAAAEGYPFPIRA